MSLAPSYRHAILACLFILQVGIATANPQQTYYNGPNGQLRPLNNGNGQKDSCGTCDPGTQRERVSGPYCGRCLPINQSCAPGYYMVNGQCQSCPCPGTSGDRKFGTSCRVDIDGQVTCDCPSEYTGRDCSVCAPGTIQNNQPPYNCLRLNSTNSFSINCPAGNRCNQPQIPQIVQPRPSCPYTSQPVVSNGCPYTNQSTGLCPITNKPCQQTPCQSSSGCQQGCQNSGCQQVCQNGGCNPCQSNCCSTKCNENGNGNGGSPNCPCPTPCGCPTNGCPGSCPGPGPGTGGPAIQPPTCIVPTVPPQPPTTPPPWTPAPLPCPGPIKCPNPPPTPPPCQTCGNGGCPNPGNGGCTNPGNGGCPNPGNGGCPNPGNGGCPNPGNGGCPNPGNGGCPNPGNGCQSGCQNSGTGCQVGICPNPCGNTCPGCPAIPECPKCELSCPECPSPCQPCGGNNCVNCPDPCNCPNPCEKCPEIPPCPACPQCPGCTCNGTEVVIGPPTPRPIVIEPCICDPRGTESQVGTQCICKVNVQGARCDQCKAGYFGISSSRPEGCLSCFCSGLSTSCSLTPYYRTSIRTDRSGNCTIELTDENHSVVYSQGSSGFSWDGNTATLSKSVNKRLFWSLPACLKGDRVTSYGGILSFTRRCSGSGNQLGADHEVILVSGSGATIFWTTFEEQKCDGSWSSLDVLLAEPAFWSSWKGEQYRRATRGDILEVLADLQLILIRANFLTNSASVSIRNVSLSTVTHAPTSEGVAMQVESCRCPMGYRGLSCENCAPGYYRDTADMSSSVFGACKPCPCGRTSEGCHLSAGEVVCKCRAGFSGPLCQDKEVITVTCDPFFIREVEGSEVDFTCSFTTNSRRRLLMRLGREGSPEKAEETTSLTKTVRLDRDVRRVACEIVDNSGVTWAAVYCAIELVPKAEIPRPPPPRMVAMIPQQNFICVDEGSLVELSCDIHYFGQKDLKIEWRREGSSQLMNDGVIRNARPGNSGTYICSASDGEVTGAASIALMVRRRNVPMVDQYPVNATSTMDESIHKRHGGDYPNYPQQDAQAQADAPAVTGNNTQQQQTPTQIISPVTPGLPKAVVDPVQITAKPGDTVVLRCNATGQEPLKFYWKSGSNDYIPVHVRISHGALIFRSLRAQDAGVYYCVAWNHLGQSTARATILLDNSVPTAAPAETKDGAPIESGKPDIEVLHPEITARPGENVNFECRSNQTGVKYTWSRVGEKMPNSSEIRNDGLLTLYRVSDVDKGTYLCTVTNIQSGEKSTTQAVLTIKKQVGDLLVPPRVTIKPKSPLRARTGEKVRLECESSGSPMPNVTWVRSIDGVEKKLVSSSINQASYEIKQMAPSDVGKYTCNAVSTAGRKSESMSLIIDDGKQCNENEFRCKSGDQCIPREDRCDSEKDCKDGSDEDNCKGSRRVRRRARL